MTFKSDAQRRWWFANNGGGGVPSSSGGEYGADFGSSPGAGFVVMTDEEKYQANRERNDRSIYGDSGDGPDSAERQSRKASEAVNMREVDSSDLRQMEKEYEASQITDADRAEWDRREKEDAEMWADQGFTPNPKFQS